MSSFSDIAVIHTIATSISRPTQSKKQLRKQRSNQFLLQLLFMEGFIRKQKGFFKKNLFLTEVLKSKRKWGSLMSIKRDEFFRTTNTM